MTPRTSAVRSGIGSVFRPASGGMAIRQVDYWIAHSAAHAGHVEHDQFQIACPDRPSIVCLQGGPERIFASPALAASKVHRYSVNYQRCGSLREVWKTRRISTNSFWTGKEHVAGLGHNEFARPLKAYEQQIIDPAR